MDVRIAVDAHVTEADGLMEVVRRLKARASEIERPASDSLRSLVATLERCARRLAVVSADLPVSPALAEEESQRTQALLWAETLPSWAWPFYFQRLGRLADQADLFRFLKPPVDLDADRP